jgi:tRNA A-37 threonylcarbamoyl transferase component Bud32
VADSKNYQILDLVATGGTAVLYRAVQTSLDRVVAVKKLHHHLTTDENFTRRFILEAKAAASLDHDNIVKIIDFGVEDGTYMMVMEFIEGESLRTTLDKWRLIPVDLALAIAHQVCMGLEHAHAKGIVHRDIKPGNIMLTRLGRAKITDFGLAKLSQGQIQHTAANSILGTPLYMSPEQAFGESVDQRSDLFSLGTVLYECVTGHQPFHGESYMGVIQNIIHQNAPHPSKYGVDLPTGVEGILLKSMHKNRENRFQSAREFRLTIEKQMGLDALNRASENVKSLLTADGATMVLPKTERAREKKRRIRTGFAVAFTVAAIAGISAVGYNVMPKAARGRLIEAFTRLSGGGAHRPPTAQGEASGKELMAAGISPGIGETDLSDSTSVLHGGRNTPVQADSTEQRPADASSAPADVDTLAPQPEGDTGPAAMTNPNARAEAAAQAAAPATNGQQAAREPAELDAAPQRDAPAQTEKSGWLAVTSEPAAEVYIDGVYYGDTPLARLELRAGGHNLECVSPKHEPYLEKLSITPGELSTRNISLQKLVGRVSLSTIDGAEVILDGVLVGVTPLSGPIELETGRHQLTVKKAGYHVWNNTIAIEAKQILPLKIALSPIY